MFPAAESDDDVESEEAEIGDDLSVGTPASSDIAGESDLRAAVAVEGRMAL
jgi:hypothetical protein